MIALTDLRDAVSQAYYAVCESVSPFMYFPDGYCLEITPWITFDYDSFHEDDDSKRGYWMYEGMHESEEFFEGVLKDMQEIIQGWSSEKQAYLGGFAMYVEKVSGDYGTCDWNSFKDYKKTIKVDGNIKVKEF